MKQLSRTLIFILFITLNLPVWAQVAAPYEVATWQGFRTCAVSYTFDDGCAGQFSKAIPIFDEFGYKLTMFTVSGWSGGNWNKLQQAANNGHEIANHTATHADFSTIDAEAQEKELTTSNDLINSKVTGQQALTMAYPYCKKGNDALHKKYFIAARGCQGTIEGKTPADFMNVSSVICGSQGAIKTSAHFKTQANSAIQKKGWLVYLLHGVDNDNGYSPTSSDTLRKSLEYLKENEQKVWVNTFGNVARYIKERNCASISETATTATSISLELSDTLSNNEWYDIALSIRRALPDGWNNATVSQNGTEVKDTVIIVNGVKYVQFDALPDGGTIVISKVEGVSSNLIKNSSELKVTQQENMLRFMVPQEFGTEPQASVYDSYGRKIMAFSRFTDESRQGSVVLDNPAIVPGVYFFSLRGNGHTATQKIVVREK